MALSLVGKADAVGSSVALPAFTAGDIAFVFAFRDGSTTTPSVPAGWTAIGLNGANTCSLACGWRVLVGTDTTTGTWTNATEIEVIVLSGQETADPIGNFAYGGSGSSAVMSFGAFSPQEAGGSSWLLQFGGHRTATNANSVALTGTTNETPATGALAMHTVAGVTAWSTTTKTVDASSGWWTFQVEVRAAGVANDLVTAVPVDVLQQPIPAGRMSAVPVDALVLPIPLARLTMQAVDVLVLPGELNARLTANPVDVLSRMHYDQITVHWEEEK